MESTDYSKGALQGKTPRGRATGIKTIETKQRHEQALVLRRAGLSLREVADRLGYKTPSAVQKAIMGALQRPIDEAATALRLLEAERLDRLQLNLWGVATNTAKQTVVIKGKDVEVPYPILEQISATRAVLKIMERRARLLGLDAPTKTENVSNYEGSIEVTVTGADYTRLSPQEQFALDQMLAKVMDPAAE